MAAPCVHSAASLPATFLLRYSGRHVHILPKGGPNNCFGGRAGSFVQHNGRHLFPLSLHHPQTHAPHEILFTAAPPSARFCISICSSPAWACASVRLCTSTVVCSGPACVSNASVMLFISTAEPAVPQSSY